MMDRCAEEIMVAIATEPLPTKSGRLEVCPISQLDILQ